MTECPAGVHLLFYLATLTYAQPGRLSKDRKLKFLLWEFTSPWRTVLTVNNAYEFKNGRKKENNSGKVIWKISTTFLHTSSFVPRTKKEIQRILKHSSGKSPPWRSERWNIEGGYWDLSKRHPPKKNSVSDIREPFATVREGSALWFPARGDCVVTVTALCSPITPRGNNKGFGPAHFF